MTQTYRVKFTRGPIRNFLAHDMISARQAAYAWLCYRYGGAPVYIVSVEIA